MIRRHRNVYPLGVVQGTAKGLGDFDQAIKIVVIYAVAIESEELRGRKNLEESTIPAFPSFLVGVFPISERSIYGVDNAGNGKRLETINILAIRQ